MSYLRVPSLVTKLLRVFSICRNKKTSQILKALLVPSRFAMPYASPVVYVLPANERQQVDGAEHDDPDKVNEVPVHFSRLDSKVLLRREIATNGANKHDEQENDTDGDVQAVKTGQRKERRTEDFILRVETDSKEAGIFINLTAQED